MEKLDTGGLEAFVAQGGVQPASRPCVVEITRMVKQTTVVCLEAPSVREARQRVNCVLAGLAGVGVREAFTKGLVYTDEREVLIPVVTNAAEAAKAKV